MTNFNAFKISYIVNLTMRAVATVDAAEKAELLREVEALTVVDAAACASSAASVAEAKAELLDEDATRAERASQAATCDMEVAEYTRLGLDAWAVAPPEVAAHIAQAWADHAKIRAAAFDAAEAALDACKTAREAFQTFTRARSAARHALQHRDEAWELFAVRSAEAAYLMGVEGVQDAAHSGAES